MTVATAALIFGAFSGFRHAFEPDHLAAVSTLVAERPDSMRAARMGAWWGLGHTLALAAVGVLLAVLDKTLPPRVEDAFEFGVAVMLLVLGARAIQRALSYEGADSRGHSGWFHLHTHGGMQAHVHLGARTLVVRPLVVGIVHGLAGSGALTALAMSALPSSEMRLAYMLLFGLASTAGMALVSGAAGLGMARLTSSGRMLSLLSVMTGVLSVGIGGWRGYPILLGWFSTL